MNEGLWLQRLILKQVEPSVTIQHESLPWVLLGCLTTPGLDGMRFALFLFKFSVLQDLYPIAGFQNDG